LNEIQDKFNIVEELLDRNSRERPHSTALHIVSRSSFEVAKRITYSELDKLASQVGNALIQIGVKRGERVGILQNDNDTFVSVFLGVLKVGAVPILLSSFFDEDQLLFLLNDSEAKVIFSDAEYLDRVLKIRDRLVFTKWIVTDSDSPDTLQYDEFVSSQSSRLETMIGSKTDMAFWFYTSGSTGVPKAVVHLHRDIYRSSQPFYNDVLQATPKDVFFSGPKLFFSGGLSFGLYGPFLKGASTVLYFGRQSIASAIEVIKSAKPTLYYTVPTVYARILSESNATASSLSSVRIFLTGGEPLSKVTFDQWKARFGKEIVEAYGAAEFGRCISNFPGSARPNTCGKLLDGFEARILDENGRELGINEIGTLFVKGEGNFSQYWHMPDATSHTIFGDWINTGDLFSKDEDGYFHFWGRNDFAFKINGLWASPMEIEEAILSTGMVSDCCVVRTEDLNGLAVLIAYVVTPHENPQINETLLRDELASKLDKYKIPKTFIVVGSLPRNSVGKLDRGLALEMAKKYLRAR